MISKEEVLKISRLARIELNENEIENMQKDLSKILDYFDLLKKVSLTEKITEKHILKSNLREDTLKEKNSNLANNILRISPDKKDGYIKVKKII